MARSLLMVVAVVSSAFVAIDAFVPVPKSTSSFQQHHSSSILRSEKPSSTNTLTSSTILDRITISDKLIVNDPTPEERGKGGVRVAPGASVKALEVVARIPRELVLSSADMPPRAWDAVSKSRNLTWATELTAAALTALHPTEEETNSDINAKKEWIQSWQTGGWGSPDDLGEEIAGDVVGVSLLTTGTDNDRNIYAKFRMSVHPTLLKASLGLELLTGCGAEDAQSALTARGFAYRSMRDGLNELASTPTERANKGTARDKRCWDVADALDGVLSRATQLELDKDDPDDAVPVAHAIVPLHERLAHSTNENTLLVSVPGEVLIVAIRDIEAGEAITRDYNKDAPRLESGDDSSKGTALDLLLQFGLPPSAWP